MVEKLKLDMFSLVLSAGVLYFMISILVQDVIGGSINWLEALAGALLFALIGLGILRGKPERRLIAVILTALVIFIIVFCSAITGMLW